MSHRLQDLFWSVDLSPTEQLVAQRLAWHADVDGKCWPSVATLCAKTRLSPRAVQNAIKVLAAGGHLTRDEALGRGVIYWVHPRPAAETTPPQDVRGSEGPADALAQGDDGAVVGADTPAPPAPRTTCTPAPDAGDPRTTCTLRGQGTGQTDAVARATGQRGRRLEPDWRPSAELPEPIAKAVAGWPPGRIEETLAEFVDFWVAEAGKRATKLDWDRTWHNRLREMIRRDRQRNDRGQRGGAGGPGGAGGFRDPLFRQYAEGRPATVD